MIKDKIQKIFSKIKKDVYYHLINNRVSRNFVIRYKRFSKKISLRIARIFFIKKDFKYWKNNEFGEIDNWQVNSDAWTITVEKIKKLDKNVNSWLFKEAYWHSFLKLYYLPKTKKYRKHPTHIGALNEHVACYKSFYEQEKKRQDNMDSKAKQIITNSGIVLTLFGALTTYILNAKVENFNVNFNIIGAISVIVLLIISLSVAVYVLDFKKYSRPNGDSILKGELFNKEDYLRERLISYILPLELNIATNTIKSKRIRFSNLIFWVALCLVAFMFCFNLYKWNSAPVKEEVYKVKIVDDIKIETDTLEVFIIGSDTLKIKNIDFEELKSSLQHALINNCRDSCKFKDSSPQ